MKTKFLAFLLILPMLAFCDSPITPEQPDGTPDQEQNDTTQTPEQTDTTQTPTPDVPEENDENVITDGACLLATNPNVHKFLTEVTYPDRDYRESKVLDYPGGYNATRPENTQVNSDEPPVYYIRWTEDKDAGKLKYEISETDWKYETELKAGVSEVAVSNLVPNTHYSYKVSSISTGKVMTEGKFDTYGSLHQVFFKKNVRNARDLGGWITYDGKMVKYHKVYRGGRWEAGTLTNSGISGVHAEGLKAQLDIRGESDVLTKPAIEGMDFCAPIIETGGDSMLKAEGGEKVRMCMQFIIDCVKANKPVYFHCSLGRDRTGTLAMVVLGLLDVIEGDISKEYEVSYFSPKGWSIAYSETNTIFRNLRTTWAYQPAAMYIWKGEYPNNTYEFVEDVESPEYTRFSVRMEKYLLDIGISQEDIDTFRELMLTEPYPDLTPVSAE